MNKINFSKMVASGNDFVVIERKNANWQQGYSLLARMICRRKHGIGADGLLLLERSNKADIRMRIFNADGSEAQMCGNGARCAALYMSSKNRYRSLNINLETKAGIIESVVSKADVKIRLTDPYGLKSDIPIRINNRIIKLDFINTGVPHAVIFVDGLDKIDAVSLGRYIRWHKRFSPLGTNVNFVEVLNNSTIQVRTYERGVEDETLACGTGSVASALIFSNKSCRDKMIKVVTKSKEILNVFFKRNSFPGSFSDVWLQGKARFVFDGQIDPRG